MGPKRKEEGLQSPQKKAKVTSESGPMARDLIEPLTLENGTFVKIMSWNVNGLRALTDKDDRKEKVRKMLEKYKPDVLCLQETKIQESHVAKLSTAMQDLLPVNYSHYWACSRPPNKLGYAGTAMFIRDTKGEDAQPKQKTLTSFFASSKKDEPASEPAPKPSQDWPAPNYSVVTVKPEPLEKKHIGEGRTIMAEFDSFVLVACYVPNSGQGLVRKDYRVNEWDPAMAAYLKGLEESTGKPVIYTGDMNVGHLNVDIYNAHAKHIPKIPGLTPEERASHTKLLECGFVDAVS
jgi:exodeoxyribonuclease III